MTLRRCDMDFQAFVDSIETMTCVISVEMKEDGHYGDIRLVAGNEAYVRSIEIPWEGPKMKTNRFVPGSLYQDYLPKDLNFETVCYRAAVEKQPVHTYVHPERFDFWFDLYMLPLKNEGNMYYCTYTQVVTVKADTKKMSNLSQDTASAVLNTCIKLSSSTDLKETMKEVIKDVREICGCYACCILLYNAQDRTCKVLVEDRDDLDEGHTMKHVLNNDPRFFDIAASWEATIGGSSCLIAKNETDMEYIRDKNPLWYESLISHSVKSVVLFPMKYGNEIIGYIWATNFDSGNADKIKETMELMTYFVASSVANYQLVKKLKIMGSIDMLTGVLNRNEMNERVDQIVAGEDHIKNLGIVFADINGLKRVNDDQGHFAGDRLLKRAASILQEVFADCDVFRAGGDEYMIIVPDTGEDMLREMCAKVRTSDLGFGTACFATGYCYVEDSKDIRQALHVADERMYADKEKFYEEHPELKR